jgi:uncharacterized membrane protein
VLLLSFSIALVFTSIPIFFLYILIASQVIPKNIVQITSIFQITHLFSKMRHTISSQNPLHLLVFSFLIWRDKNTKKSENNYGKC